MIDTKALRETHNKAVWELDQFEKLSFVVAKTLVDVYPALLDELDAARAELEAASDAIADRGIAEGNCSLPLPERINYFLSEFKRERSERCDAEMALDKARAEIERLTTVHPAHTYHDDDGDVLWYFTPICSPPFHVGTPTDSDWPWDRDETPESEIVWTRLPNPATQTAKQQDTQP